MRILVTGANGFIGSRVCQSLTERGHMVTAAVRDQSRVASLSVSRTVAVGEIGPTTNWSEALAGIDAVVHLAARVHVGSSRNPREEEITIQRINVAGTEQLFDSAATVNVNRFIFVSSVKAQGERSGSRPLTTADIPAPEDAYGRSKLQAEDLILARALRGGPQAVILRPGFVYGWPAKGNFRTVVAAVRRRLPLPLGAIRNRRDMIYVGNLSSAIAHAVECTGLESGVYLLRDGDPVSTPEFFRRIGEAFQKPALLFPVPAMLLRLAGQLADKSSAIDKLLESLELDDAPFRRDAGWTPPYNMLQGLREAAALAGAVEADEDPTT